MRWKWLNICSLISLYRTNYLPWIHASNILQSGAPQLFGLPMKIGSIYLAVQPKTRSICLPSQLTVWAPETMATLVYSIHKLWLLVEVSLLFMGGYKSTWPTHWGTNLYKKPSTHHHFLMISACLCPRKKHVWLLIRRKKSGVIPIRWVLYSYRLVHTFPQNLNGGLWEKTQETSRIRSIDILDPDVDQCCCKCLGKPLW